MLDLTGTPEGLATVDALRMRVMAGWEPPRRRPGSQWADAFFYLSAESAAEPGRWRTYPFQREILDAMTDPAIEQVSVMKAARVGYTKLLGAAIGSFMHQDPCPISVVQPTIEDAQGYSKEEIAPMLRDCPALRAIVPEVKARDSDNTILHKRFRGGILSLIGANSGRGFRRITRRVMAFDEPDAYPISAGSEGDPIRLGIRRTETFWNRKIIAGSTPLYAGTSRIEKLFLAGDQRRYYVPCVQCGHMAYLVFNEKTTDDQGEPVGHFMTWPKGQPEAAHFVCRLCGGDIPATAQRAIVEAGEWRSHAPFAGHASFHLWTAYSFSPNATWAHIAKEFQDAHAAGPEDLKTFVNTVLGETWKEKGDAPPWEQLYTRREMYPIGTCPHGVLFLTVGVDVQKDRFVYEVVGWGRGKRSWSIDIGDLMGDTADLSPKGPWGKLDDLLDRTFPHAGGSTLRIGMLAIDSGFQTQTVYQWARQKPMSRVIAVKGVDGASVLLGTPSAVDVSVRGKKLKRGYKVWPVGVSLAKGELYGWLALQAPTDEERAAGIVDPPGYCRFPQHGEEYFKGLTSEQLVARKNPRGYVVMTWELIAGRQNHPLDCRAYARAAAAAVGIDRFQESDWHRLERQIDVPTPPAPVVAASTPDDLPPRPQTPPPVATAPVRPRASGFLQRRSSSWLRGRR